MSTLKHLVHHRPRLLIGMAVGVLVWLFLPVDWKSVTRALMAWNAGVGFYLGLIVWLMLRATHEQIRQLAEDEDSSHVLVVAVVLVAAVMSLCAIVLDLAGVKGLAHRARRVCRQYFGRRLKMNLWGQSVVCFIAQRH